MGIPASIRGSFQGTAQAFRASLSNEPILILAALITVYIVLGVLYESYIHPITILSTLPSAGVGALLALIICRTEFSVIALIGDHSANRYSQEERHHDGRFCTGCRTQGGQESGRRDLSGLPVEIQADHDDHNVSAVGGGAACAGFRSRLRAAPTAGNIYYRRAVFSQVLTLYTTPVIYLWFDRLSRTLRGNGVLTPTWIPAAIRTNWVIGSYPGTDRARMNISRPFINRPVATTLLTIGMALAGLIALRMLPVVPAASSDFPTILCRGLPGASPETMATSVAAPLERQLGISRA